MAIAARDIASRVTLSATTETEFVVPADTLLFALRPLTDDVDLRTTAGTPGMQINSGELFIDQDRNVSGKSYYLYSVNGTVVCKLIKPGTGS